METTTFKIRASPVTFFIRQETEELADPLLFINEPPIEPLSRGAKRKDIEMKQNIVILLDSGRTNDMDVRKTAKSKDKINNLSAWLNLAATIFNVVLRVLNLC